MEVSRIENLPPPPGIISSIKAGFDAIAARITAILLPLLLNLFLWLGPRLQITTLFKSVEADMVSIWKSAQVPAQDIQLMVETYDRFSQMINLFSFLRTLPVGVSSLFALNQEGLVTPFGNPQAMQVTGLTLPVWFMLLTFVGWIGGALYYHSVAWVALTEPNRAANVFRAVVQTLLLSILGNLILFTIGVPILLLMFVATQISLVVSNLLVLFIALGSVWIIVPMFFWAHGIFLNRQNVLTSMLSSIQLTRFTLPTSSLFVLTVFLLSYGLNFLWRIPSMDSWLTLLGIFGHSFVTTALLAASFIYYRDMTAWVQTVLDKLRPNNAVKQA